MHSDGGANNTAGAYIDVGDFTFGNTELGISYFLY
jgi:hypothetical protein